VTDAWLSVRSFFAGLFVGDVPAQIIIVAACLLAGWFAAAALRTRLHGRRVPAPAAGGARFAVETALVIAPVILSLLLVLLARFTMRSADFDAALLDVAVRLIGVYAIVRVAVFSFAATLTEKSWVQHWELRASLLIWFAIAANYLGWLDPIIDTLDGIGVAAGRTRVTLWSVFKLLFTLSVFILTAAWISRWLEQRLKKLESVAPSTRIGLAKFANAFLIGLSVLLGLNAAGVDLTALTVLTGAIGLGLGFGLQAIAANFVSGFVLLMDRSIKPGDVISFSGQSGTNTENFGWVHELRGRYVVVRDRDGVETLVPNQQLISNPVVNWSYTDPRIRLKLPVRISYRDDPELALNVLVQACVGQKRVLSEPAPASRLLHFGDSGIELELRFWISDPQEGVNNVRSEVNRAIWRLFKQHGLTMPIAQREVLVHRAPFEPD
jgi:small-conductance mechanosensitive channel